MHFQSPLSNFCNLLIQTRDSAKKYSAILTKNEAANRAALIDPILRALGWDIANPNMVEIEKTAGNVRADYTLYDSKGIPKVVLEAKPLGTDITSFVVVNAVAQYAFNFRLPDLFLTDGLKWHHFNNFNPNNFEATKILDINEDPIACAVYLVQKLDAAQYWPVGQNINVLSQRIDELESTVSNLQSILANMQLSHLRQNLQQLATNTPANHNVISSPNLHFVPLDELDDMAHTKPSHLRLPDGRTLEVTTWTKILSECCKFALSSNSSINIPLLDSTGKTVYLLGTVKPPPKINYFTEMYNGQTIYIRKNYNPDGCIENSIHVLKQAPKHLCKVSAAVVVEK